MRLSSRKLRTVRLTAHVLAASWALHAERCTCTHALRTAFQFPTIGPPSQRHAMQWRATRACWPTPTTKTLVRPFVGW